MLCLTNSYNITTLFSPIQVIAMNVELHRPFMTNLELMKGKERERRRGNGKGIQNDGVFKPDTLAHVSVRSKGRGMIGKEKKR